MAVNETLTGEEFADRFTLINGNTEQEMRAGNVRSFETTAGTAGDGWLYLNLMLHSEASEKLDDLAFEEDGELVVRYSDMSEEFTAASASESIGTKIPETYVGEPVKVAARITEDDQGRSYINVLKIQLLDEMEGGTVSLNPDSISKGQKVEQ